MLSVFKQVFGRVRYSLAAVLISFLVFTFAVWLPNIKLIIEILLSNTASISEKIQFLFSFYGSIATNFTIVSASYTIVIAILFGISMALLVYYVKEKRTIMAGNGAVVGVGGLISGIFGIGCAACGTFILTSLLAAFGAGGVLAYLPFGGEEFGFLGVGLLAYSVYIILKKINEPAVCVVED